MTGPLVLRVEGSSCSDQAQHFHHHKDYQCVSFTVVLLTPVPGKSVVQLNPLRLQEPTWGLPSCCEQKLFVQCGVFSVANAGCDKLSDPLILLAHERQSLT